MKLVLTSLILLFYLSACGSGSGTSVTRAAERLTISGAGDLGIFESRIFRVFQCVEHIEMPVLERRFKGVEGHL